MLCRFLHHSLYMSPLFSHVASVFSLQAAPTSFFVPFISTYHDQLMTPWRRHETSHSVVRFLTSLSSHRFPLRRFRIFSLQRPFGFLHFVTSTCHGAVLSTIYSVQAGNFPRIMLCCFLRHFMSTFFLGGFLTGPNY
ncbi:hypothetical protein EV401DRAFT_1926027 [Pisolithus croceorrhizus]|nr:hypothetical protein EV401DRAFT_1926027 [Pisolithus croceorrhizus]